MNPFKALLAIQRGLIGGRPGNPYDVLRVKSGAQTDWMLNRIRGRMIAQRYLEAVKKK